MIPRLSRRGLTLMEVTLAVAILAIMATSCQRLPRTYPTIIRPPPHRVAPSNVWVTKVASFMRATPAGIEMIWRITGMKRAMRMVHMPCLAKNSSVRAMSAGLMKKYLPYVSSKRVPPRMPIQYENKEPDTAPALLMARIAGNEKWPCAAIKPAKGMTSSDGMGTNVLSRKIITNKPT